MSRRVVEVTRQGRVGSDGLSNLIGVVATAVDAVVLNADSGKAYRCTAALTLTLPAATSPGWSVLVDADDGDVTLASTMTVNGSASIVLADGNSCLIYSDGSALFARFYYSDEISSSILTSLATDTTAAGLALLDDVDADAQIVTLGGGASGTPVFKAADQEALLTALGYTGSVSGRTPTLPNGLVLRYGVSTATPSAAITTFPAAFPNACLSVVGNHIGTIDVSIVPSNVTSTGFNVRAFNQPGVLINALFSYIAIGY